MPRTPADWHERFHQQAAWTAQVRRYLLSRLPTTGPLKILEVGCGTGAVTAMLRSETSVADGSVRHMLGLDRNLSFLRLARRLDPDTRFVGADALRLPFSGNVFSAVVCHFFLLWVPQVEIAMAEMVRAVGPAAGDCIC